MSTLQQITVTWFDHDRLYRLVERIRREGSELSGADTLEEELDRALIVEPKKVPATVVTMNSEFEVADLDTGQAMRLTLVFPGGAAPRTGRISVLAPLGLALLGAQVGQEIDWPMPGGKRRLRVEHIIFQPEAEGRFNL
jgi:regulator of nucleoside diphosphate kinase